MPLIVNNPRDRLIFRSARASTAHALNETVEQLQAQLQKERAQHRFNVGELEKQIATLLRDLLAAKYELARRDTRDALAEAPSPSAAVH